MSVILFMIFSVFDVFSARSSIIRHISPMLSLAGLITVGGGNFEEDGIETSGWRSAAGAPDPDLQLPGEATMGRPSGPIGRPF